MTITATRPLAATAKGRPMSAFTDSATMLRRSLRHAVRYPTLTVGVALVPVIMLLLFSYLFGDTIAAGIGGGFDYIDFIVPGILLMTLGSATQTTAVGICTDLADGIVARFRTMPIARTAVLTGHVVGAVILNMASIVLVIAVGLAMGFRPGAGVVEWVAALGLVLLTAFALTWVATALGMLARLPEGASNIVMPLSFFFPFLSTTFVPLDALPSGIRWFSEYQPFTPIIETLRGLLVGGPIGHNGWLAVGWCVVLAAGGYLWAKWQFRQDPRR
ncbi:ABC transporter permease [Actinophytocola oryzae]|uniref:Transport permease protein n=1 Tax=Actinophytocola oryzae TaxID=502181 RepID=A0A4R7VUM2_9PSEU|nr:ABC transporter permease [Actinophytocola oryzae]TDV53544.1 ABC-2 type transport system permease protein [Actinophytocola oryzae]